jgi:hypothetical protein
MTDRPLSITDMRAVALLLMTAQAIAMYRTRSTPDAADWSDAASLLARLPERTGGPAVATSRLDVTSLIA